jgi:hypothetical protein
VPVGSGKAGDDTFQERLGRGLAVGRGEDPLSDLSDPPGWSV